MTIAHRCLVGLVVFSNVAGAHPHSDAVVAAVKRASPAVVNLYSEQVRETSSLPFWRERWFDEFGFEDRRRRRRGVSLGSGVIIDARGFVLTNEHVVARAAEIRVVLSDGREFQGEVIAADADFDIAVLRLKAADRLPVIPLGRSSNLQHGESVIAIGNPFGLSHTVTVGVVSALGRALKTERRVYRDLVQTDASINPGNSGGPLLNLLGELVGVNTAIYESGRGIGFAIPVDRARRIVDDLLRFGEVVRGWLGFDVAEVAGGRQDAWARAPRIAVVASRVESFGPAAGAGIRRGDVIARVRGEPVESESDFADRIRGVTVGEAVPIVVVRGGDAVNLSVTAGRFPTNRAREYVRRKFGFVIRATAKDDPVGARGVVISGIARGSVAHRSGLRVGDRVLQIGASLISSVADFEETVSRAVAARSALILIQRGRLGYYLTLSL